MCLKTIQSGRATTDLWRQISAEQVCKKADNIKYSYGVIFGVKACAGYKHYKGNYTYK